MTAPATRLGLPKTSRLLRGNRRSSHRSAGGPQDVAVLAPELQTDSGTRSATRDRLSHGAAYPIRDWTGKGESTCSKSTTSIASFRSSRPSLAWLEGGMQPSPESVFAELELENYFDEGTYGLAAALGVDTGPDDARHILTDLGRRAVAMEALF